MDQAKDFQHNVAPSNDPFGSSFKDPFSNFNKPVEKVVIDCPQNDKEWCVDD